jgi:hypothetical protein
LRLVVLYRLFEISASTEIPTKVLKNTVETALVIVVREDVV